MKHPIQRSMIGKKNYNQNEGGINNINIIARAHSSEQSPFPPQMNGSRNLLSGGLIATRQARSSSADEIKADKAIIDQEMADRKTKTATILDILKGNNSSNEFKGFTAQDQDLHQSVESLSSEDDNGLLSGDDSIEQDGISKKFNRSRVKSQKTNILLLDSSGRQYDESSSTVTDPLNSARLTTNDGNNELSSFNDDALKSEINNLQFQLSLERSKARPQKLVSGAQFRSLPTGNLKCELCSSLEFQLKKSKESNRSLKLQLTRSDDALHDIKKNKMNDEGPKSKDKTLKIAELEMLKRENSILIKNNEDLTAEVEKLSKSKHNTLMMTIEEMQKQMDDAERAHREELLKSRKEMVVQQTAVKNLIREKDEFETYLIKVKDTVSVYKTKLDATEEKLRESNRLLQEVRSKSVDTTHLLEINRLKEEVEEIGKKNFKLHADLNATNNELKLTKEKFAIMLKKLEESESEISRVTFELDSVNITITQLNMRNEDLEKKNVFSTSEYNRMKDLLAAEKNEKNKLVEDNNTLTNDINRATARQHDFLRHMTSESENTKKALEKAIASSVRLCVVAPTVNVHVTDKKLKFKANLSEEALRSFIINDVLENYSFLFKQEKEDQSPQGSDLHTWVQYMLTEMQSSIEQHVHSAMEGGV
jgi:hypothetical protein